LGGAGSIGNPFQSGRATDTLTATAAATNGQREHMTRQNDRQGHFSDRLAAAVIGKRSVVCVGLDPDLDLMPPEFVAETAARLRGDGEAVAAACCAAFCREIIDAVADGAAVVKPQAAFFEQYGAAGRRALGEVVEAAHERGLEVILDVKRGDIASTARAYARASFGGAPLPDGGVTAGLDADAVTLSPYLGEDSLEPFVAYCDRGRGVFVLTRTSNAGAAGLQEREVDGRPVYLLVADLVARLGAPRMGDHGYSDVGVVAGATAPEALAAVRAAIPHAFILVPGVGAQGGQVEALRDLAAGEAAGFVVNASRSILYAWRERGGDFRAAAASACEELRGQLAGVLLT
jgi:orotidine-5'-phosphate decarboxylase